MAATGATGAGVPAVIVVIAAGTAERLATAKLNGPPAPPVVTFLTATVAATAVLVKLQLIWAAGKIFAAGIVSVVPLSEPKLAGFPVTAEFASLHVAALGLKLPLAASVTCTCAFTVVT